LQKDPTAIEAQIIKCNRALAHLRTGQFDAALTDTNFPNFDSQPSEKSLYRAAEALYQLQRFPEARKVLETLCEIFPLNKKAAEVLERARSRCEEQSSGDYNFECLQAEARRSRPPLLDHATYPGSVEVRQVANKGRGLFITKAVRAGDLVFCEKAFSYAWIDEKARKSTGLTVLLNTETDGGFAGGQADLVTDIVQKLHRNPSLGPGFRTLYHGEYQSVDSFTVDGKPVVDT
jgi:tetratricopeptide (TPR) repeat protein